MPRGITENDVWAACDALLLEGARPTIERVRQRIGRGSPNTVSPHLDAWFKSLGARIKDPRAFSAPPELPDPVQQAAKHFWEVALAETRIDFDERLREGFAEAVAAVEAEKERAAQADAASFEAATKASQLQSALDIQRQQLDQAQRDVAAERARLDEVRTALTGASEFLRKQEEKSGADLAEMRRQIVAAIERADAADRRVAMELERERTARGKAERHAESLQKTVDTLREKNAAVEEQARQQLGTARDREETQKANFAITAAELALERQRLAELVAAGEASAAAASTARAQITSLQASLDRLTALVEAGNQRDVRSVRKQTAKPSLVGKPTAAGA